MRKKHTTKISKLAHKMMFASGIVASLLSFWAAVLTGFFVANNMYVLLYVDGYKPATFTIEELGYFSGDRRAGRKGPAEEHWAVGVIDGKKERFGLGGYVTGAINSLKDLEQQLSVGQKLPVLYNPDAPEKLNIRVQYPEKDFEPSLKRLQAKILKIAYLPWMAAVGLCLFLGIVARDAKMVLSFGVISLFPVAFVWAFVFIKLLMDS